jgi:hypothetical protein
MIESGAIFSPCGLYRYLLWREWNVSLPCFTVIGLNPSTADETKNDPTMRRCIDFAMRNGAGRFVMLNLFAYRATNPKDMWAATDPVGGDVHDNWLKFHAIECARQGSLVVAAWGISSAPERAIEVGQWFPTLYCLGRNKEGGPKHPLFVPAVTPLTLYRMNPVWETPTLKPLRAA